MSGMTTSSSPGIAQRTSSFASGAPRNGLLKKKAQEVAAAGRGGDTELAHVNPREKALLKKHGGSGTVNPKTGLKEYMNEGGGGTGDGSGENDHDVGGGSPDAPGDRDVGTVATAPQGTTSEAEAETGKTQTAEDSSTPGWLSQLSAFVSSQLDPVSMAGKVASMAIGGVPGMAVGGAFSVGRSIANTIGERAQNETGFHEGMNPELGGSMDKQHGAFGPRDAAQGDTSGTGAAAGAAGAASGQATSNNYAGTTITPPNGLVGQAPDKPTPETHPQGSYQVNQNTGMVEWTPEA